MRRRLVFALFIGATLLAVSGCGHVCRRFSCGRCNNPEPPLAPVDPRVAPQPNGQFPQPGASQDSVNPFDPLEPQPYQEPARDPNRFPDIPGAGGANDRIPPESESRAVPRVDLLPPRAPEVKEEVEPNPPDTKEKKPGAEDKGPNVSFFPADVPNFARVKPGVYSGEKPFTEGLTWLKDKGFVAVLYLHAPGESTEPVQRSFEAKGIRYKSLAVSPEKLDRALVDQFNQIVTEKENHRIYVFDRNRSLAGPLWYLHFRLVDGLSAANAVEEATGLGFREKGEEFDQQMLRAAARVLEEAKP